MKRDALSLGIQNILATGSPLVKPDNNLPLVIDTRREITETLQITNHKPFAFDWMSAEEIATLTDATGTVNTQPAPTLGDIMTASKLLEDYVKREREREASLCALLMNIAHQNGFALECGDVCVLPISLYDEGFRVPDRLTHCVFLGEVEKMIFIHRDALTIELPKYRTTYTPYRLPDYSFK